MYLNYLSKNFILDRKKTGFTLLELLIVIGILAILTTTAVYILNPAELVKQTRDSRRLSESKTINSALNLYLVNGGSSFGSANTVYISLPDTSATCASFSLPSLPSGWTYSCKIQSDFRKIDGTGWIPVNFNQIANPPLAILPVDPQNDKDHYYAYVAGSGSWVVSSMLESEKYLKQSALTDGGTDNGRFEIGSNLQLWANASGLVGYWKFDENSGTIANDSSGNNNSGTLTNGPVYTTGKINGALSLSGGSSQRVDIGSANSLNFGTGSFSVAVWGYFRDFTYPKSWFMVKKSAVCYWGAGNAGWDIETSYTPLGLSFCFNDGANFISSILSFDSNYQPSNFLNKWALLTVVFDKNTNKIRAYINGVKQANELDISGITGSVNNASNLSIGSEYSWQTDGILDDIRIYNRVLSEAEIASIYNATK